MVSTLTIPHSGSIELVHAGPNVVVAFWNDDRFGNQEIFARAFDLQGCP